MNPIKIRMLSTATSVEGQGVGSAYLEQVALVKQIGEFQVLLKGDKGKAQINHVHTVNPTFYLRMGKKTVNVCYVHFLPTTLDGSIKLPKPIFAIFKWYVRKFYRKADEIVVVNPIFIRPLIELGIKEENITYIPNYVSPDSFFPLSKDDKAAIRDKLGIRKEAFVVLGVGQVQTRKGVLDFIAVAKQNPGVEFVWAGGFSFGKMTDGYKELKQVMDNPPPNVKFLGIVKREKMNEVYNASDLLFMPSYNELFPMAILEAASCHVPFLLRDLDLYKDILFDDYLKGKDNREFADLVAKLSSDPRSYEEAKGQSARVAAFYCLDHVKDIWRAYYPRILKKWSAKKPIRQ